MNPAWKNRLKRVVPGSLRRWVRTTFGWRWLRGNFSSWSVASAAADRGPPGRGVERVVAATRAVRSGRAAWDRDGVTFAQPAIHAPLVAALRRAAASEGGSLTLIDFGGALGSTWWQHREELRGVAVDWRVVELPALVAAGKEWEGAGLRFYETLDAADADGRAKVILFSSVLQYLEDPWALLGQVAERRMRHVIMDRTAFVTSGPDQLTVQHTPPEYGGGRMPCWLFARERLEGALGGAYERVSEWPVPFDVLDGRATYRGMHFVR